MYIVTLFSNHSKTQFIKFYPKMCNINDCFLSNKFNKIVGHIRSTLSPLREQHNVHWDIAYVIFILYLKLWFIIHFEICKFSDINYLYCVTCTFDMR